MAAEQGPTGLGGWLILPALGLIVFPIRVCMLLATTYLPIFQGNIWALVTTPGSQAYHPLWGPLLILEIVFNLGFVFADVALLYLFFTKSYRLPKLFVIFAGANLVYVVTDYLLGQQIPAVAAQDNTQALTEMLRSVVVAGIWIPYFLTSKRVKNTFVKKSPTLVSMPAGESG